MPASESAVALQSFVVFGDLLKYLRRRARLTQRELSIAVGYSEAQISRLEQNLRPPDLAALAALFIPALYLENEPEVAVRLMELAAAARGESLPLTGNITITRSVAQEITETIGTLEDGYPNNLPLQLTSFVGREPEMTEIKRWLVSARLVTLTGAGGSGKTRLALEVAAQLLANYREGIWLVELASLSAPELVAQTVAAALGVRETPDYPPIEALTQFLRRRRLLLVLDNCEHVVDTTARLAELLLRSCPNITILATSREALNIPGEVNYHVLPLTVPPQKGSRPFTPASLLGYEAVHLFVERAHHILPAFSLTKANALSVAQICRRLDGIPLAIELAAARLSMLTVEQIAARLEDAFTLLTSGSRTALPRHQTLWAVIDWSYALLSEAEQVLFRRLSIFAGGWTLEAAEEVTGVEAAKNRGQTSPQPALARADVLDLLSHLVDKSLVLVERSPVGETRYRMLETVRQYGFYRLNESDEQEIVRKQHFDFYLRLVEEAEPKLLRHERQIWTERLEREHDNLRVALEFNAVSRLEGRLWLGGLMLWFWQSQGYMSEGLAYLEKLLVKAKEQEILSPSEVAGRAKALWAIGGLAWSSGDPATGQIHLEESVRLWRQISPAGRRGLAEGPRELGIIAIYNGDLETAQAALEESIQLWREMAAKWELALALYNQGLAYQTRGDLAAARLNYEESLAMFRALNESSGQAIALFGLGHLAGRQGDYATALPLLEECLTLHRGEKDSWGIAEALCLLGELWQGVGDHKRATRFYGECLSLNKEMGDIGILKLALHNLGKIVKEHGQLYQAARLFGATNSPQSSPPLAIPWSLTSPAEREQDIAAVSAALGAAEFAAQAVEWETTLEWAIEYAAVLAGASVS
jgi:predicted ATPase